MLNKDTLVNVTNRSVGTVGYRVPDLGVNRKFQYRETKEISVEELRKLSYIPSGRRIIANCLLIDNEELVHELLGDVEPEYNYTENDIRNLLEHGSIDSLLDCLDFAPKGVVDLVKRLAVEIELNDVKKRQAIFEKTGFNVTSAIEINKASAEEDSKEAPATRRVQSNESEGGTSRRTQPPKYKVVEK